ncbi:MAG: hypothetical protein U1F60_08760 [Planctomycetota bacterium]
MILFEALCEHAGRLLRRRRLRGVEPSDVAADVLFHGGAPGALRAFALRQRAKHGLDQAVRGIQRAVQNAVWQLHEAQDPEGARAYRAVRLLFASNAPFVRPGAACMVLGSGGAGALEAGLERLVALLRKAAAKPSFAGIWQLRCHRALSRRLRELLASVHDTALAAGVRFECTAEPLRTFVAAALRAQVRNELLALSVDGDEGQRVVVPGREASAAPQSSAQDWNYAALEPRHVEAIVGALLADLDRGQLAGRTLYGARRQRLRSVVVGWGLAGQIVDPLPVLERAGVRKAAAYDDRALLCSAVQAAGAALLAGAAGGELAAVEELA